MFVHHQLSPEEHHSIKAGNSLFLSEPPQNIRPDEPATRAASMCVCSGTVKHITVGLAGNQLFLQAPPHHHQ